MPADFHCLPDGLTSRNPEPPNNALKQEMLLKALGDSLVEVPIDLEALKSVIREAFKAVEYPGDHGIAGCSRSLTLMGCDDCDVLAAHFKGTTWQEHNSHALAGCDSAPSFLYPEALHYYLPAFLLAELEDSSEFIPMLYDHLENKLAQGGELVSLLSRPQRQAVIEYFRYRSTHEGVYDPDVTILTIMSLLQR
jgi:hypothetical protein